MGLSDWVDFSELRKPKVTTVIGLIVAVVGLFLFADYIYGALARRLPAVELAQGQLETDAGKLHDQVQSMGSDLRVKLQAMSDQMAAVSSQMKEMSAQLLGIRSNMMALCTALKGARSKNCDLKAMLSDARSLSRVQALFVDSGKLTITDPSPNAAYALSPAAPAPMPYISSSVLKEELPTVTWGVMGVTTFYPNGTTKDNIASAIVWASAAKSAHWRREGDTLKVDFKNGEGTFHMARDSGTHAAELLKSLNTTADALNVTADSTQHTADEGAPKKP